MTLLVLAACVAAWAGDPPERGFVSGRPAESWEQALVSGNGTMGAMAYGRPLDETIILNHARLYMPLHLPVPPVNTAARLADLRALIATGAYQRAADLVVERSQQEGYGPKRWTDPFIPAFDLKVGMEAKGEVKGYRRSVDFQTGEVAVRWEDERGEYRRRLFVSRPDEAVVVSIAGPVAGAVDCRLELATRPTEGQGGWGADKMFQAGIKDVLIGAGADGLTYRSRFRRTWPGSLQGYEGAARIAVRGGTSSVEGRTLVVRGADEVLVLLRLALLHDVAASRLDALRKELRGIPADYERLRARHARVHGGFFNRMRLDLGGGADRALTSEELIAKSAVGRLAPALLEKEFDAARYAVICSSGASFPNLQGIWGGTWGPPWSGDFTLNGNVPCALAADLPANFAEGLEPFFRFLEAHLDELRENARRLYGCRGIHVPSRASTHGLNNHFDATWPMTFWTAGAGWAAQFYYDYYLYTGDRRFLAKRAVPFMKEAALFYEDFLFEGPDGRYVFSPSYSPENNPKNNPSQACLNATMDIAVARELLGNLIAACETLRIEPEGVPRWRAMRAKLPDYQINADGAVKEWTTPLLEDNYAHRHVSHLYALFSGLPDDIATNAPLRQAFRVAAEKRMEIRRKEDGGVMAFGLVQMGQAAASLRDAGMAYEVVDWLANHYWNPNLVSTHNPKSIFNTDICGGLPAVVLQMLVDSQPGRIELLPALPPQWPAGRLEGARGRGQLEVRELAWGPDGIRATLRSGVDQTVEVRLPGGEVRRLKLVAGKDTVVEAGRGTRSRTSNIER